MFQNYKLKYIEIPVYFQNHEFKKKMHVHDTDDYTS